MFEQQNINVVHTTILAERKENILERCIKKGNIIFKSVVADCEDYLLLIHFGKFTFKKR